VATVAGSTVTIVGAGSTTITATQAATASYGSNSITASLVVTVPPRLLLDSNGVTIKYIGNAADVPTSSALFVQENVRGTVEWFAVVKDGMKNSISAYANGTNAPFIPGQSIPAVPFNNIVTTLMTDMSYMLNNKPTFNHEINSWDTSNIKDMAGLFGAANFFNRDISAWNVSEVTNMSSMFFHVYYFNQNISGWNTAKVTNMAGMFSTASSFNQPISNWNVTLVTKYQMFRSDSALSTENTPPKFR
jgi:surface protein